MFPLIIYHTVKISATIYQNITFAPNIDVRNLKTMLRMIVSVSEDIAHLYFLKYLILSNISP